MLGWTPFSYPFNLTQQPACTIPCGFTSDGLPIGLQLVGPMFGDALVLRAARAYETTRPIPKPNLAPLADGARRAEPTRRRSAVDVDDGPSLQLAVEQRARGVDRLRQADLARHLVEPRADDVAGDQLPGAGPGRVVDVDAVDAVERDAAQDERHHRRREVAALGQAAGGDGAVPAGRGADVGERVAADRIDRAGPALALQGLAGRGELGTIDHLDRAQVLEVLLFLRPAGRCGHGVAEPGEQRRRDRADAARRAGDQDRPARRRRVPCRCSAITHSAAV